MLDNAKFVLSKSVMLKQYEIMNDECDEVSYSYKTNLEVGHLLQELTQCSFSVHRIELLKEINDKSKVWFFAQAWDVQELDILFNNKVNKYVVDNLSDLNLLLNYIKDKNVSIQLLLRMRLKERTVQTGKHYVYGFYSRQVNELLPKLKTNNKIEKLGIHFHRKTENVSEWSLKSELINIIEEPVWKLIDIVNIGGGIPINYKNFQVNVTKFIIPQIRELKEWLKSLDILMFIEPGRFIAGPACELHTEIKAVYDNNIIVNASVYNSAMDTFTAHVRLLVKGELEQGQGNSYTIKGRTPCSMDIFRYRVYLNDPKVTDTLIFVNAGAYNYTTTFVGLEKLKTEIID